MRTAASAGCFENILALVKMGGLEDVFDIGEDITFFAPTDAAFFREPTEFLDALFADRIRLLRFFSAHISPRRIELAELFSPRRRYFEGKRLERTGEEVRIGGVLVVLSDLNCREGILHGIDGFFEKRPSCAPSRRW